eukprot:gene12213-biopygen3335
MYHWRRKGWGNYTPCGRETHDHLESVVDQPLQASQGSNHHNAEGNTAPQTPTKDLCILAGGSGITPVQDRSPARTWCFPVGDRTALSRYPIAYGEARTR